MPDPSIPGSGEQGLSAPKEPLPEPFLEEYEYSDDRSDKESGHDKQRTWVGGGPSAPPPNPNPGEAHARLNMGKIITPPTPGKAHAPSKWRQAQYPPNPRVAHAPSNYGEVHAPREKWTTSSGEAHDLSIPGGAHAPSNPGEAHAPPNPGEAHAPREKWTTSSAKEPSSEALATDGDKDNDRKGEEKGDGQLRWREPGPTWP